MPLRTTNSVEKNVISVPTLPITVPANKSTEVLPSVAGAVGEFAARYVFNAGSSNLYYAYGRTVSLVDFEAWIVPGQQFDASNCGMALNVISTTDCVVSRTILQRQDLTVQPNIL